MPHRWAAVLGSGWLVAGLAAVTATAVGVTVSASPVSVSEMSRSDIFAVQGSECDADVSLTEGTLESLDGLFIYDWVLNVAQGANPCDFITLVPLGRGANLSEESLPGTSAATAATPLADGLSNAIERASDGGSLVPVGLPVVVVGGARVLTEEGHITMTARAPATHLVVAGQG